MVDSSGTETTWHWVQKKIQNPGRGQTRTVSSNRNKAKFKIRSQVADWEGLEKKSEWEVGSQKGTMFSASLVPQHLILLKHGKFNQTLIKSSGAAHKVRLGPEV